MDINRIKAVGFGVQYPMGDFKKVDFSRRSPGDTDIVIDIMYAGICHSDIHVARGEWGKWHDRQVIPGHEIVGIVKEVGKKVTKFKIGDIAGIGCMVGSCGECPNCKSGYEQYCSRGTILTYDSIDWKHNKEITRGGYSTVYVVDQDFAIKVPKAAAKDLEKVPSLCCAGITTYSPISKANVNGKVCAVIGFGGLGHMAVKYLKSFGAKEICAFDKVDKSDAAKQLGVEFLLTTKKNLDAYQQKFDFIISTVPFDYDAEDFLKMVKKEGEFAIVGLPEFSAKKTNLNIADLVLNFGNIKIYGSQIGGIPETQECIDYSIAHKIYPDVEIIDPEAKQIDDAYKNVREGKVRFRYVIDMTKLNRTEAFHIGGNINYFKFFN